MAGRHTHTVQIALVLQEPLILPTTVAQNISYGKPLATMEEIEAAAHAANADELIEKLPQQYRTVIGEGGARLSVGEKQRINLGSALVLYSLAAGVITVRQWFRGIAVEQSSAQAHTLRRLPERFTAKLKGVLLARGRELLLEVQTVTPETVFGEVDRILLNRIKQWEHEVYDALKWRPEERARFRARIEIPALPVGIALGHAMRFHTERELDTLIQRLENIPTSE